MINVVVYIKQGSIDCQLALEELKNIQRTIPHRLIVIDIDRDEQLRKTYAGDVPMVQVGPFSLRGQISRERLLIALGAAQDRTRQLGKIENKPTDVIERDTPTLRASERFSLWMSNHYLLVINLLLAIFIGGAFLPPVLMRAGSEGAAKVIYAIYSPFCHQLPFRSWFLFGAQGYYPRELAHIPETLSYEHISGSDGLDLWSAREFLGTEETGYKTALCQRDIAIFLSMLIFGVVYGLARRQVRPIRWYVLIFLGLLPMLIDGGSQLKSVLGESLPDWLPVRESTPLLRTITGGLFGFLTAWFILPYIEESAQMTRRMLMRKKIIGEELSVADQRQ